MEAFLIRGWDPVVPGWRWLCFRALANQRSAGGVGVSTSFGAVSTREITVFVTVRGGFDPGDHRFRVIGVVDVWRDC